jgi:two-component sensor histidine kinase
MAHRVPPIVVEVIAGCLLASAAVIIRKSLSLMIGDVAPYATGFVAVALAAVLAGWRAGLVAMIVGQILFWIFILEPAGSLDVSGQARRIGLVVATVSQAILLIIIALYQREVDKGISERERRLALLDHALNEIDHRTRNNHQTVLALIHLQAQRSSNDGVKEALHQVADRIQAIAHATEKLALRSGDLDRVRLDDHLCGLCKQIERGLSTRHVQIECEIEEITMTADRAVMVAIIVNELVTNALKHAFDGRDDGRVLVSGQMNGVLRLNVADNGVGMKSGGRSKRGGLGTKLVDSFARQLGAKHEVTSSEAGTRHDIVISEVA